MHTPSRHTMSQIVDQRLFELIQLVSVSTSSIENEPRRRSARSQQSRQIVSFAASPCGRLVIFAAANPAESGEGLGGGTNDSSSDNRPCLGSILLSKCDESSSLLLPPATNCDSTHESVETDVQWLPWYQDTKYRPTCLTLSPESDFCLIGCENGSLFILSTKTLCPGFEPRTDKDSNHRDWSNKRTHKIYPIDFSAAETKGKC